MKTKAQKNFNLNWNELNAEYDEPQFSEMFDAAEAGWEAIVVRDHDGRVEGLEVEDNHRMVVEVRLGFEGQRDALGRSHPRSLLHTRTDCDVVQRFRDTQHHRLYTILNEKVNYR